MSSKADEKTVARQPRRVNEILIATNRQAAEPLFDSFWRSGELGLLFGEPGAGKSLLAVQLGEVLARGSDPMPNAEVGKQNTGRRKRRKVLYVDMVLSDRQFVERYHGYAFSQNLYRYMPDEGEDLFEWVRSMVTECGFKVVVIDDLSMVSRTEDGTRETLELMRRLRRLTVETGVSVLVLADSFPFVHSRDGSSPERDLRRSRVLCGVADTVFAIRDGQMMQTRSRSGEIKWTRERPLNCKIDLETGSPLILFEESQTDGDDDPYQTNRVVKALHENEHCTFRDIAKILKISKSQAQRLYAEWTPEMGRIADESEPLPDDRDEEDLEEEEDRHREELGDWMDAGGATRYDPASDRWLKVEEEDPETDASKSREDREGSIGTGELTKDEHEDEDEDEDGESAQLEPASALTEAKPQASANFPENLQRSIDHNGREIFVETWDEHRQKPLVWYRRNKKGFQRVHRDLFGTTASNIKLPFEASG